MQRWMRSPLPQKPPPAAAWRRCTARRPPTPAPPPASRSVRPPASLTCDPTLLCCLFPLPVASVQPRIRKRLCHLPDPTGSPSSGRAVPSGCGPADEGGRLALVQLQRGQLALEAGGDIDPQVGFFRFGPISSSMWTECGSSPSAACSGKKLIRRQAGKVAASAAKPTARWSGCWRSMRVSGSWVTTTSGFERRISRTICPRSSSESNTSPSRWRRKTTSSTPRCAADARCSASRCAMKRAGSCNSSFGTPLSPDVTTR